MTQFRNDEWSLLTPDKLPLHARTILTCSGPFPMLPHRWPFRPWRPADRLASMEFGLSQREPSGAGDGDRTPGVCRRRTSRVGSTSVTVPKAEGERVVLGRRNKVSTMVPFRWTEDAPLGLNELEWAEELGAKWEGDELVTYDYPTFIDLFDYYEKNEYLPDND